MTDTRLAFPKALHGRAVKKQKAKEDAAAERKARLAVRKRDKGVCRVPTCGQKAQHLHHVVYRSKSRGLRWRTENLVSLCADCHALVHAGRMRISGNADRTLVMSWPEQRLVTTARSIRG